VFLLTFVLSDEELNFECNSDDMLGDNYTIIEKDFNTSNTTGSDDQQQVFLKSVDEELDFDVDDTYR